MQIIDTHVHLYVTEFDNDREEAINRGRAAGISQLILPAIDATTHEAMLQLEAGHPDYCRAMMGVHPCSVNGEVERELAIAKKYLDARAFVAVGEIGLDFYWDTTYTNQQYQAFHTQIQWALEQDIPIAIHSRNATEECISVVREHQHGKLRGVFHCFSGTAEQAKEIVDLGFYLGIGGVLTFKNAGLDKVLEMIAPEHLVLETDAPYLAPVPYRGKRNEPSYLTHVLEKLAAVKGVGVEVMAEITTANAKKLFGC